MNKKAGLYFLLSIFIAVLIFFYFEKLPISLADISSSPSPTLPDTQTIQKVTTEFLANICAGHEGVNCSIINKDASVVCNDGTIDKSLSTVYAVPQCQKTIEAIITQESDFMAESGCFPPSEMTCINGLSYQNLLKHFDTAGLANSELSKNELAQCRKDIASYEYDNKNYKQCLIDHGQPNFELSGKMILPILKAGFCPLFYGNNSSYDFNTDLCLCDRGYFLNNGQCIQADKICQEKYGPRASSKNGSCYNIPENTPEPTPISISTPIKKPPSPSLRLTLVHTPIFSPSSPLGVSTNPQSPQTPAYLVRPQEKTTESKLNPVQKFFTAIMSGIKNILKLF